MKKAGKSWIELLTLFSIVLIFVISCKSKDEPTPTPTPPPITYTDADNNVYDVIQINNQLWLKQNLRTKCNGSIPLITVNGTNWKQFGGAACCVFNNDVNYQGIYGLLYNWDAVQEINNCATDGWHVPTYLEWLDLRNYLVTTYPTKEPGNLLKEMGNTHWNSPSVGEDAVLFRALPGGCRDSSVFKTFKDHGFWWSSTPTSDKKAWYIEMHAYDGKMEIQDSLKWNGYTIRLVKNIAKK